MEKFLTGVDLERMGTRSMAAVLKRLDLDAGDLHDLIDALPLGALTQTEMPTSGGTADGPPNDE